MAVHCWGYEWKVKHEECSVFRGLEARHTTLKSQVYPQLQLVRPTSKEHRTLTCYSCYYITLSALKVILPQV